MANNGRLSDSIINILVNQAVNELRNANIYSSMENNLDYLGYANSAHYMHEQSKEERKHFKIIWSYLKDRGAKAELDEIPAALNQYDCILEAFADAQTLEFGTTEEWNQIYNQCMLEKDWITLELAKKFMKIQKAEEEEIMDINTSIQLIGKNPPMLQMWDRTYFK